MSSFENDIVQELYSLVGRILMLNSLHMTISPMLQGNVSAV